MLLSTASENKGYTLRKELQSLLFLIHLIPNLMHERSTRHDAGNLGVSIPSRALDG